MTARNLRPFALLILALAVVACDKGRQTPLRTQVRVINVAPNFNSLDFRREQSQAQTIDFKSSFTPSTYDEDTYDFNIEGRVGSEQRRILSFPKQVLSGTTYAFVLYGLGDAVGNATLEYPNLPVDATDSQIVAIHAGESLPAMDVHIAPAGTNVNGAVPWGTLSFLQTLAPRRLTSGSYEVTLTAAGDPNNVLLTSRPFELGPGRSSVFVITPEAGQTNELLSVYLLQDSAVSLYDRDAVASLRVINATTDRGPRDGAVASQFSPPLFSSVPFAQETAYAPAPVGSPIKLNATPPGNPGVLELDMDVSLALAVQHTAFITGDTGVLKASTTFDDNRRLPTLGKIRFFNAAAQVPNGVDFYVSPPGTGLTLASLVFITSLVPGGASSTHLPFNAGDYEIVLLQGGTATIVAGPIPVTLNSSGLYSALVIDGATAGTAELVLLDDFP